MSKIYKQKGFALLYAILLSGAVLSVGLILMNIVTKQLVFSSLNRDSDTTYYYLANSGRECLLNYASFGQGYFYDIQIDDATGNESINFNSDTTIICSLAKDLTNTEGKITLTSANPTDPFPEYKATGIKIVDNGVTRKLDLSVKFNRNCLLNGVCNGTTDILSKSFAFLVADGYSQEAGNRVVKRSAPSVIQPF